MNQNRWLDLTPLLDVFLILLFVVLINRQIDQFQMENTYAAEVEALMSQNTRLQLDINQWESRMNEELIEAVEDRIKYDSMKERTVMIDLHLKTAVNQIWLNDKPTSLYLVDLEVRRESQKNRIRQLLREAFEEQGGTGVLLLVTLNVDEEAYRYAYRMMQEAAHEFVRERPLPESYVIQLH